MNKLGNNPYRIFQKKNSNLIRDYEYEFINVILY